MNYVAFCLVSLSTAFYSICAKAQVQVYDNFGQYSKSEISGIKQGDKLFAIRKNSDGYDVKKVSINLEETLDSDDVQAFNISGDVSAVFFIKGVDLKEGKIDAENLEQFRLPKLNSEKSLSKSLNGTIRAEGKVVGKYVHPMDVDLVQDYTLIFKIKGKEARIVAPGTGMPSLGLLFLGDLNRDGYVDAYLNMDRNEKDGNHKLFLSEIKNGKYLLKETP